MEDGAAHALRFGWLDYSSFVAVMLMSALVGVYYGFFKKQDSMDDYFLGGRRMGVLPIAMSLIASNISGVTMLVVPADIYTYGSQISVVVLVGVPVVVAVVYLFLPTFYKLQYESSYEYLEHRFSKRIRTITSILYTIGSFLHIPLVMYVPCLAFYQVSGVNVNIINPLTCLVCVFYTCVGGLRAVVWTDALQLVSLILASVVVLAVSVARIGGLGEIWTRAEQGGRVDFFNMDPDLTIRTTFWNVFIGEGLYFLQNMGVSPSSVQRYLALPTISAAKRAAFVLALGFVVTRSLSCITGVVMYAFYHDCDPVVTKVVPHGDNMLPHFIMDVAGDWPGLPGIFIAGVFSAALSTASSLLNTLAGTLYKDFLEGRLSEKPDDKRASLILKALTLGLGIVMFLLIFVVEKLGSILEVALSLTGITSGATFGLFLLGLFVPWAEAVGALAGACTSIAVMSVICLGALHAKHSGTLSYPTLPKRTDGCNSTTLPTLAPPTRGPPVVFDASLFPPFRLAPFYFIVLGVLVTVVVGGAVSAAVRALRSRPGAKGGFDDLSHPDLFTPPVARYVRQRLVARARAACGDTRLVTYSAVPSAPGAPAADATRT